MKNSELNIAEDFYSWPESHQDAEIVVWAYQMPKAGLRDEDIERRAAEIVTRWAEENRHVSWDPTGGPYNEGLLTVNPPLDPATYVSQG